MNKTIYRWTSAIMAGLTFPIFADTLKKVLGGAALPEKSLWFLVVVLILAAYCYYYYEDYREEADRRENPNKPSRTPWNRYKYTA